MTSEKATSYKGVDAAKSTSNFLLSPRGLPVSKGIEVDWTENPLIAGPIGLLINKCIEVESWSI